MSDRYQQFTRSAAGGALARRLGLPRPSRLRRHTPGQPVTEGPVLVSGVAGGHVVGAVVTGLRGAGVEVVTEVTDGQRLSGVVLDATTVASIADLEDCRAALAPRVKGLRGNARVILLAGSGHGLPDGVSQGSAEVEAAAAQRGLEGLMRTVAKELRGGGTATLVRVGKVSDATSLVGTLTFLLSARSAYVSGQMIEIGAGVASGVPVVDERQVDALRPLEGRVALVTGAARGIGAAIATVMARDGAHVVCLDIPAQGEALARLANRIGGTAVQVDITETTAPQRIADQLRQRHGGVDVVVHNAGITRDKLLVNTDADRWGSVLAVNLAAQLRINEALLAGEDPVLHDGGRIIGVSSTSGIAGNRGQANYATSKAGVIGVVHALAPRLASRGITVNAVAPGFIETEMTARMPLMVREAGRRANSLAQGGLPVDVAETVSWLAWPSSSGITGQVVRVCGQSLVGA